ncbi:hypothetical protein PL2TA16_04505, partial [Pseudoalteromonas luteoviolacea 2ta16]
MMVNIADDTSGTRDNGNACQQGQNADQENQDTLAQAACLESPDHAHDTCGNDQCADHQQYRLTCNPGHGDRQGT